MANYANNSTMANVQPRKVERPVPDDRARALAEERGIDIREYKIIYKLTEDLRSALEGKLKPREDIIHLGRAVVRQQHPIPRALLLEQVQHFTDDALEGVAGDGADRVGDGKQQRHNLHVTLAADVEEPGQGGVRLAVVADDIVAAQDARFDEALIGGGQARERVGLVRQPEGCQPHPFQACATRRAAV